MKEKTEIELIKIAECGDDNDASLAMNELRNRFDKTYGWCEDCDFLVCKEKDCCLNKINQTNNIEQSWISVEDNPPEKGITVIVYLKSEVITLGYRPILRDRELLWQLFGDMAKITDIDVDTPLYWMPLPEPPKV